MKCEKCKGELNLVPSFFSFYVCPNCGAILSRFFLASLK